LHQPSTPSAPNFTNLGVLLRAILVAEVARFLFLFANTFSVLGTAHAVLASGAIFEICLLVTVLNLFIVSEHISKLNVKLATFFILTLSFVIAACSSWLLNSFLFTELTQPPWQAGIIALLVCGIVLFYFHWRQLALSPALAEARLSALQARIRPHFLFNSLNTVLGLIRPDPKRAESVLENLADLFRALLADGNTLVSLDRELELAKAYIAIETLRLGGRLKTHWHCDDAPMTAQVPQLILQPLLENAVIHGIEPATEGGEIHVNLFEKSGRLVMVIRNPLLPASPTHSLPPSPSLPSLSSSSTQRTGHREGNHMALANIRERLDLHFDAEARMTHFTAGGDFVVQVEIPLVALPRH
jgi:two-component system sensor histidine kinase AlgZ